MMASPDQTSLLQGADQRLIALELLVDDVLTARDRQDVDAVRSTVKELHHATFVLLAELAQGDVA